MSAGPRTLGITVRPFEEGDFPAVRELYANVWGRRRSDSYDRMRFVETMDGLPIATCGWSKDNELAGFFTLWPLELSDGRRVVQGAEAMDVMTDSRFRGKGVFPALADRAAHMAAERGVKLLFGAPNEAIYESYLKRLAWASPTMIRTYLRPLALPGAVPLRGLASAAWRLWTGGSGAGLELTHEQPETEALAACLAGDRPKRGRWRLNRTPEWYGFRYRDAGRFDYRWACAWRDGALKAFAVWGIELGENKRMRRANIADVIGADAASRRAVLAAAAIAAGAAGANFIAAALTSRERGKEFVKAGFVPFRKSPLIAKVLGPDSFDANPFSADGWDLIGGDFDYI